MSPRKEKRVKIPCLPNSVGKKNANDAGPKQGHDTVIKTELGPFYTKLPSSKLMDVA